MEKSTKYQVLGHYIVADPEICHGKPTFRGTRIMVFQVLQMVAEGMDWDTIIEQCHNSITRDAIAEAVSLSYAILPGVHGITLIKRGNKGIEHG